MEFPVDMARIEVPPWLLTFAADFPYVRLLDLFFKELSICYTQLFLLKRAVSASYTIYVIGMQCDDRNKAECSLSPRCPA
jgi:hypothetical protein